MPTPLYLLGARLRELYPFITVTGNIGVIVGVLSYVDTLAVTVTVDADVVPDLDRAHGGHRIGGRRVGRHRSGATRGPRPASRHGAAGWPR